MHSMPYPPDWSREESPETFDYWNRYSRRWAVYGYALLQAEEEEGPWRITAIAGYLALFLVFILFLGSMEQPTVARPQPQTIQRVAAVQAELQPAEPEEIVLDTVTPLSPRVIETSYPVEIAQVAWEKPVESAPVEPEVFDDPFAMFGAPPEKPTPPPTVTGKPVLAGDVATTAFTPDFDFAEVTSTRFGQSSYAAAPLADLYAGNRWHTPTGPAADDFFPVTQSRWQDQAIRKARSEIVPSGSRDTVLTTTRPSQRSSQQVKLMKKVPAHTTAGQPLIYVLELVNDGSRHIDQLLITEHLADLSCVLETQPPATMVDDQLTWTIEDLAPHETRVLTITCDATSGGATFTSQSSLEVVETLAAATRVFVPDVTVEITVPVRVEQGQEFEAQFSVRNNSDKTFRPSDMSIELVRGLEVKQGRQLTRRIQVPAPGKSIEFPLTLTTTDIGEAVMEAKLNLDNSLTVPVRAHTTISEAAPTKPGSNKVRRPTQDFASLSQ
ncbi:hypothetical protein [Rubinisphaera margarita]|uniref:hypothetical protein n=1 Tax=Rubinisphaera margarita TaxID=2909586 RepID=UPI001EE8649B|nr:hypothetical protein [Rubinisphaera margarita]MCG6156204.1 hypothetical protein [Rubinisphaera margarita]